VLAFHIEDGDVDGVSVSGLNLAMVGDTPQLMIEGNWRVGLFVATGHRRSRRTPWPASSPVSSAARWRRWRR
jgi:hypothetical protein